MATLDYQSGDDSGAQRRRGDRRLKWLGQSRTQMWEVLAAQIGARYEPGRRFGHRERVVADVPPWRVVLDCYSTGEMPTTWHTRMRAAYVNADGFRFTVYRKGLFTGFGKLLGLQDVAVGYPEFDDAFVIKGNDEQKLRRLFANAKLRALIQLQPQIHFCVNDDDGVFLPYPKGVDQLCFTSKGDAPITDLHRLKLLYELFAETLEELCRMDSAYDAHPGVST